jgi:hypothetical protein
MPTLLKWEFTGGDDGSELAKHRGEQRAYAGDKVEDEMMGQAMLDAIDRTYAFLNFGTSEAPDVNRRRLCHVRVLQQREKLAAEKPTGRSAAGAATLPTIFGRAPAVITSPQVGRGRGRGGRKGLGKTVARGRGRGVGAVGFGPPAAAAAAAAAAPDAAPAPAHDDLLAIGAAYADSDDDEGAADVADAADAAEPHAKRAKPGATSFRALPDEEKAAYRARKYRERQEKEQATSSCCRMSRTRRIRAS